MSSTTYAKFLTLSLLHDYYRDGVSKDWQVVPSESTRRLLEACKYLWKAQQPGQATAGCVLGQTVSSDWLLPLPDNAQLVFYLVLVNPGFLQFTDPSMCPGQLPLRWVNAPQTGLLQLATGNVPPESEALYAEAKRIGAWGIIDLKNAPDRRVAGQNFQIAFAARATQWTYFAVLRGYNGGTVEVQDGLNLVQFSDITAAVLDPNGSLAQERKYAEALLLQSPGARLVVFRANTPLKWQEAPRPKIALSYQGQDKEVLQANLPAPAGTDWMVVAATQKTLFDYAQSI